MELKYLRTYNSLGCYLEHFQERDAWEHIMIAPYWQQIAEWAPFPIDYMKPKALLNKQVIINQMKHFNDYDLLAIKPEFERVAASLPKADDDPMTIAFYPSDNSMEEGIFGTGAWGNIILNINPLNHQAVKWTPFVFAHEYHHIVLGHYWYCIKECKETTGSFLEAIINEGQADLFAQSIYPSFFPSWHRGVSPDCESSAWEILKKILCNVAPIEEFAPYMFGNESLNVPTNAGYYFGHAIVNDYLKKHPGMSFSELLQTPHRAIFNESRFA